MENKENKEKVVRVLQVVTCMNRGGLETMIMNHYRKMDRKKIQFDFLVHRKKEGTYEKEILELGGKIYRVPRQNPFSVKYYHELNKFFKIHNYKVVHCHLDCMSAFPLRAAKKHGVVTRVAHSHNKSQDKDLKYPIKIISKHLIPQYATQLLACGKEAGDWMFGHHGYEVIKNAIEVEKFRYKESERQKLREELQVAGCTVLGHVGRFSPAKNHSFLINIFEEYSKKNPDAILWLIGEGEGKKEVQNIVKQRNLEKKVIFWGSRPDVNRLYQAMDVFVFPSLYEGLPVTMVEAQANGLPCVISNNVPKECILTDLVQQLPLEKAPNVWGMAISEALRIKRHDTADFVKKAGFDVEENIYRLEKIYGL